MVNCGDLLIFTIHMNLYDLFTYSDGMLVLNLSGANVTLGIPRLREIIQTASRT